MEVNIFCFVVVQVMDEPTGEKLRQSWHEVAMAANYFASALDFYMLIWVVDFL